MEEAPLLGALTGPDDETAADLFGPERASEAECRARSPATAVPPEPDELPVLRDAYLGVAATAPGEEPPAAEDAAPPPAYSLRVLSSLLPAPLGAGVRVIPVEIKEAGSTVTSNLEEAAFPNPLVQESCCKFLSSQEAEDVASSSPKKDSSPMVICQLKGGTQVLCIDNAGTRELKALHLVPQYQDQNHCLQSDGPKPLTTLVGRFLPVPAKLNLITQLDNGALPSTASSGPAFPSEPTLPGPPKITLAGYCDCFASGDFCNNCNCNNCCNNLHHEMERFNAIKVCLDRNPEAFQPKIGKGRSGDVKPRHNKGCNCKRSGCLKNYCECYEAKIMCSSICKCIGCKNYEESPERKTLMNLPKSMETGEFEGSHHLSPVKISELPQFRKDSLADSPEMLTWRPGKRRKSLHDAGFWRPFSCISWEVVEAACACLLAQGEEAEKDHCSQCLAEQMILEEFGRCLSQILHTEFKCKGLKIEPNTL